VTDAPIFLGVEQVLAVHRRVVAEFGGSAQVRDHGLLESAAMMPAARFAGEFLHDGIPAMAAAYLFHICRNHPFMDGNKRTALAAAEVFVLLNGLRLKATGRELERLTLGVAAGRLSKAETVEFFRKHVAAKG
jgi:death-on-curing protein